MTKEAEAQFHTAYEEELAECLNCGNKTIASFIKVIENQRDNICRINEETTLCPKSDPCCGFMKKSCTWWTELKEKYD